MVIAAAVEVAIVVSTPIAALALAAINVHNAVVRLIQGPEVLGVVGIVAMAVLVRVSVIAMLRMRLMNTRLELREWALQVPQKGVEV